MRAKPLILLVIALGCGMIAAVGVSKAVMNNGDATPTVEATTEIFVAVQDLKNGAKITADAVKLEKWPNSRLPEGAITQLEVLEQKFTNQQIFAGEPILERKLSDSLDSFSTQIPPGYRVFDIPGSSGYIKPGDHVDVVGTFKLDMGKAETKTVLRNIEVFGINGITSRDSEISSNQVNFQLLVKESQLEALTLAHEMGELRLSLRPFGEDRESDTDNGRPFLDWIDRSAKKEVLTSQPVPEPVFQMNPIVDEKKEILVITPEGITRYEYSEEDSIPRMVIEQGANDAAAAATPVKRWGTPPKANVYSGYAGYAPTYPTSAPAPVTPPSDDGAPVQEVAE
ncbi:MAG: Flp pilus assembly protein CpaB [Planctomycetales bacterium]|nr:Flp pilus assembly protein CpaB [Planctomycetales bacterium]